MNNDKIFEQEYVQCSKGKTFILYSSNLYNNENKIKIGILKSEGFQLKILNEHEENTIIILLHGLNGNCFQFTNVLCALIYCNFKFITLDFYGHGNSSRLKDVIRFTEELYTNQIYDVLEKKKIINSKFIVIGFSMGCIIATHLSVDKKIKIEKLCLISAAGLGKPKHRFLQFLLKHNIRFFLKISKKYSYKLISEKNVKNEYYDSTNNLDDVHKRYQFFKENHEKFLETFLKVLSGINIQNSKKLYSTFLKEDKEVLFIYGRDDKITPYGYTLNFIKKHKITNNVNITIFPKCSHLVLNEKSSDLIKHLIFFLQ